jgi:hypothetical protein
MDGDLQHPPEMSVGLRDAVEGVDLCVASRHVGAGTSSGLSNHYRGLISSGSTVLAKPASRAASARSGPTR